MRLDPTGSLLMWKWAIDNKSHFCRHLVREWTLANAMDVHMHKVSLDLRRFYWMESCVVFFIYLDNMVQVTEARRQQSRTSAAAPLRRLPTVSSLHRSILSAVSGHFSVSLSPAGFFATLTFPPLSLRSPLHQDWALQWRRWPARWRQGGGWRQPRGSRSWKANGRRFQRGYHPEDRFSGTHPATQREAAVRVVRYGLHRTQRADGAQAQPHRYCRRWVNGW